ncbi:MULTISPECIES: DUF456 domain-containing protein [Microvirgula]|nr:hypothetical protein DFO50_11833 [Microvirgula sp. AG722]
MEMLWLGWLAGLVLIGLGLAGCLLPALPGLPLVFLGGLAIAWAGDFRQIGSTTLIVTAVLAALGMMADFLAGTLGARAFGASGKAVWGALLGSMIGLFFGLPGLLLGPLLGAAIGEWLARRDAYQAGKVGLATLVGLVIGTAAKIGAALAMIGALGIALLF